MQLESADVAKYDNGTVDAENHRVIVVFNALPSSYTVQILKGRAAKLTPCFTIDFPLTDFALEAI